MSAPVERVANDASPTSTPTTASVGGSGSVFVSHEKQTNHLPVRDRVSVTVLGVPSTGRCNTTWTAPTFERISRSPSRRTPLPYCGYVIEVYRPKPLKRGKPTAAAPSFTRRKKA